MIQVFSKDNVPRYEVDKFDYSGTYMGEVSISFTVESPDLVGFAIGDYAVYDGERFELNYTPSPRKQATKKTTGNAFVYDTIKLNSLADETTRCDFLDYVTNDNFIAFSNQPTVAFVGTADDLAKRIKANLDRTYPTEGKQWTVTVDPTIISTLESKPVSTSNIKCWEAIALFNSLFKLNFTISNRAISIGYPAVNVIQDFGYGNGKCFYELQKVTKDDAAIVTRLRAYGSTKNIPARYYNDLKKADGQPYINEAMFVPNLMLPDFAKVSGTRSIGDGYTLVSTGSDVYIDSPQIAELGIREGSVFFDGSDSNYPEIYPSMEGIVAGDINGNPLDTDPLDVIVSAEVLADSGLIPKKTDVDYLATVTFPTLTCKLQDIEPHSQDEVKLELNTSAYQLTLAAGKFYTITIPEITYILSQQKCGIRVTLLDVLSNTETLILEDLKEYDINRSTTSRVFSGKSLNQIAGSTYRLKIVLSTSVALSTRLVAMATIASGQTFTATTTFEDRFHVQIKDVGFDLRLPKYQGTSAKATISMKSGACTGRDFEIDLTNFTFTDGVGYSFDCARVADNDWQFPNINTKVSAGDKFVFLNIEMPDVYITAGANRVLTAGKSWLADNDHSKYTYVPKIDEIELARAVQNNPDLKLREGMSLVFAEDLDLGIPSGLNIPIQTLNIKVGYSLIPTYEITLSDSKTVSTLQKIQDSVKDITKGNGSGSGINVIREIDSVSPSDNNVFTALRTLKEIKERAISKTEADTVQGLITFLAGIKSDSVESSDFTRGVLGNGYKIWMEDGQSHAQFDHLAINKQVVVNEAIINQIRFQGGVIVFSGANMEVSSVENIAGYHILYFDTKKGSVRNQFALGDIVKCQRRIGGITIKYYMSVVTEVSVDYIKIYDASAGSSWHDGDGLPEIADAVVQFGSKTDLNRQSAIEINVLDGGKQTFYQYLDNFTTTNKNYIDLGMVDVNGVFKNMIRSYGDAYFGARDRSTYLEYDLENKQLVFKGIANFIDPTDGSVTEVGAGIQAAKEAAIAAAELDARNKVSAISVGASNILTASDLVTGDIEYTMPYITLDSTKIRISENYYTLDNKRI